MYVRSLRLANYFIMVDFALTPGHGQHLNSATIKKQTNKQNRTNLNILHLCALYIHRCKDFSAEYIM